MIHSTFNNALIMQYQIMELFINNKLDRMWKAVVVT